VTRILLVDDYPVTREGLKEVLQSSFRDVIFGEAESGAEAVRKGTCEKWDVVVLDVSLPDRNGLEVLKELRKATPGVPILILSMYPEEQYAIRALRAGAAGYVTKKTAAADLVAAVKKVLGGGRFVSPSLAETLADETGRNRDLTPHRRLSDREFQVFRLLALGKTVKAISGELSLSPQTISTHRSRILEKMQLATNADLTQYALANRLID
jgi:two-component system invasion response regulator UvrY